MKFRIIGAERQTGAEVSKVIEAPTPSAAEDRAHQMGVMVERIEMEAPPPVVAAPVPVARRAPPRVQTVEQTSKRWKGLQVIGVCLIPLGCLASVAIAPEIGFGLGMVGLAVYVYGRMAAWWHHG
jgi:hypothetical protein